MIPLVEWVWIGEFATAPVMMCNDDFYEAVSHKKADEIVGKCK